MPKNPAKRAKEYARLQASLAAPAAGPKPAAPKKHKRRRLTDGLIGVSSLAVLTIYGLGYARTNNANGEGLAVTNIPPARTPVPTRVAPGTTPAPTLLAGTFHDGTYTAVGSSRHGDIEATVVVSGGKIVSAKVTSCDTRYPCSDVNALVSEVVTHQDSPIHYISGATDSSKAYTQAVQKALAEARP
ncbi:MAG: FMN-binding protein [Chloroflexota bacterium]